MHKLVPVTSENAHLALHIRADKPDLFYLHYNTHWIGHSVANDCIKSVLIEYQGEAVGFTCFGPSYKDDYLLQPEAEHIAELHHLVIRPQSQRQGIGEKTIKAIAAELLKAGYSELRVAHHPEAQKAANFYKKLGFVEHGSNYDDDIMLSIKLCELV